MGDKKPENVVVWMANRSSYVESTPGTILRIKNASKFGENNMGFKDQPGDLVELKWDALFKLRPTLIEINFGGNPLSKLVETLELNYEKDQIIEFFETVKVVSMHMTDILAQDLLKFLDNLTILAAFSFAEIVFSPEEWTEILQKLAKLNIRGIDISDNILNHVAKNLDVSLIKLSGNPGVKVKHFKTGLEFVTVKALIVQELFYTGETDAEQFLDILPACFPRLKTLVWDWNVVDPELAWNDRTKLIVQKLIDVNRKLNLDAFAIISYTPSPETKSAMESIARTLNEELSNVRLHQFASKGLSDNMPNFSLILAGQNESILKELIDMYITDRSTIPPMGKLLRLCEDDIVPIYPAITIDFGGFDKNRIKQLYSQ